MCSPHTDTYALYFIMIASAYFEVNSIVASYHSVASLGILLLKFIYFFKLVCYRELTFYLVALSFDLTVIFIESLKTLKEKK